MDLELSISSAEGKSGVREALTDQGFRTVPGSVRMAHPFSIVVQDVAPDAVDEVVAIATAIDPYAGALALAVPTA